MIMEILYLGVVWVALALIGVAIREIVKIVVGGLVVCMLIHILIHIRRKK